MQLLKKVPLIIKCDQRDLNIKRIINTQIKLAFLDEFICKVEVG